MTLSTGDDLRKFTIELRIRVQCCERECEDEVRYYIRSMGKEDINAVGF